MNVERNEIMGYLMFKDNCPHCKKETTANNDTVEVVYIGNSGIRFKCSHCDKLYTLKGGFQKANEEW